MNTAMRSRLAKICLILAGSAAISCAIPAFAASATTLTASTATSAAAPADCPTGVIGWDGCTS